MGRICKYLLIVFCFSIKALQPCDIHVCLTWTVETDRITFRCKVNYLTWKVMFYNPLDQEIGHCLSPIPNSICYPSSSKNRMFQERQTNTTILIVRTQINSKMDGPWTCTHGTNRDKAIVNITVLEKETILRTGGDDNCYEDFLAWTMIGFTSSSFLLIVVVVVILCTCVKRKEGFCYNVVLLLTNSDRKNIQVYLLIALALVILLSLLLPISYGLQQRKCTGKKIYFILYGFGLAILVICILPRRNRSATEESRTDNYSAIHIVGI